MREKYELNKEVFSKGNKRKLLCVNAPTDNPRPYTNYEALLDPQKCIDNYINAFKNTIEVGSDMIPFVESNFLEVLIPSIFGAETHVSPGDLIDVKPIFTDIYETEKIGEIDIFSGEMENAIKHLTYIKENAPEYLYVNPTRQLSPLDCAIVLFGGEFYTELYAEPELALAFMDKITDVTIKVIKEFKKVINQPLDEMITPRGYLFNGIRLTGDAVVNLSPAMIEEIMCPMYKKFEKEFGSVMLHYCTTPAPSTHVLPALINGGGVSWVDNWQGYKTLLKEEDYLNTKMGICTDISSDFVLGEEIKDDKFFTIERSLVASSGCTSVEHGKKVFGKWNELLNY